MARHKTPTRDIHNTGLDRVIGVFPSRKNGAGIPWESQIEDDGLVFLENCRKVLSYNCQPEQVSIPLDNGESFLYTPDAVAQMAHGRRRYIEFKPKNKLKEPEIKRRLEAAAAFFRRRGDEFVVLTDVFLRQGQQIHNLRLLYRRYGDWQVPDHLADRIFSLFPTPQPRRLGDVLVDCVRLGYPKQAVYALLFRGALQFDRISTQLRMRTLIWR